MLLVEKPDGKFVSWFDYERLQIVSAPSIAAGLATLPSNEGDGPAVGGADYDAALARVKELEGVLRGLYKLR